LRERGAPPRLSAGRSLDTLAGVDAGAGAPV